MAGTCRRLVGLRRCSSRRAVLLLSELVALLVLVAGARKLFLLLGRHINIGLDPVHRFDRREWIEEGDRHTTRCLKPFIMYGRRCAGPEGSQCHSVSRGSGPGGAQACSCRSLVSGRRRGLQLRRVQRWDRGVRATRLAYHARECRAMVVLSLLRSRRVVGWRVAARVWCLSSRSTCYAKPNRGPGRNVGRGSICRR